MKDENRIVHVVWIGKRFSKLECLTVRLLQNHGHVVYLWGYEKIDNVPEGVIFKDASLVMPKGSLFTYTGKPCPNLPNCGMGSFSHWSDQFQMNLLYKYGGIYSQLDVASLKALDFEEPYAFAPLGDYGISTFLMKCPKGSQFAEECVKTLNEKINKDTMPSLDWHCSMHLISDIAKKYHFYEKKFMIPNKNIMEVVGKRNSPFWENARIPPDVCIIHWCNAANFDQKENPIPGSVYEYLLKKVGIISAFSYIKGRLVFRAKRLINMLKLRKLRYLLKDF